MFIDHLQFLFSDLTVHTFAHFLLVLRFFLILMWNLLHSSNTESKLNAVNTTDSFDNSKTDKNDSEQRE